MITSIDLTESGVAKFNKFFSDFAGENISEQAIWEEALNILFDRALCGESLVYELGRQYTNTSSPEVLHLDASDVTVTEEADE